MFWTTPCYLRGPFAKEGSARDFECESDMPKWTFWMVRFKIWHAAMGPPDEDMLIGQAHDYMLMGKTHEHMLMGQAHEPVLMGQAHGHVLIAPANIPFGMPNEPVRRS